MKVIIIGAGAMGGLYGAFLSKKNQVIMVDTFQKVVDNNELYIKYHDEEWGRKSF